MDGLDRVARRHRSTGRRGSGVDRIDGAIVGVRRPAGSASRFLTIALLLMAALAPPRRAGAQVSGVIMDPAATPVPGVVVTLWTERSEVARTLTDDAGRFTFTRDEAAEATALVARRIGYEPLSTTLGPGDPVRRLMMTPLPAPLPVVAATVPRRQCPAADDGAARALWESVRTRYRAVPDTVGHIARGWGLAGDVPADAVGVIEEDGSHPRERREWTVSIAGILRREVARHVAAGEYAIADPPPRLRVPFRETSAAWWYAPLHRELADHFVSPVFGELHTFRFDRQGGGSISVTFCPVDGKRAEIEGTLTISADTALVGARWSFVTPRPREDAGGEVEFVPPRAGSRDAVLTPSRSLFWRRLPGPSGLYYEDVMVYSAWTYTADGSIGLHHTSR